MTIPAFCDFYRDVTDHEAFVWQREAAEYMVTHRCMPKCISVPTGMGKTDLVVCWVYALAVLEDSGLPHALGRRYVHAVERRLVVDGTAATFERLRSALSTPSTPAITWVSDALSILADPNRQEPPLDLAYFHGAHADNREWIVRAGATVITTTLTQITLRLLCAGPGVSSRSARLQMGLLGHDTVVIVDEPHLAQVHLNTLRQVEELSGISVCTLGATLPPTDFLPQEESTISCVVDREQSVVARQRLEGRKRLVPVSGKSFADCVKELLKPAKLEDKRTIVFCNTIKSARSVAKKVSNLVSNVRVVTSHIRTCDRADFRGIEPGSIVIATQTLEAGVDFSADLMVTEAAPWPAMMQRLGRLSRYGESPEAMAYVYVPEGTPDSGSVAVYGEDIMTAVTDRLQQRIGEEIPAGVREAENLRAVLHDDASPWPRSPRTARMDESYAAELLMYPDYAAASYWLRDLDENESAEHVIVAWRDVLSPDILPHVQPCAAESLTVPINLARDIAEGRIQLDVLSDVESSSEYHRKNLRTNREVGERFKNIVVIRHDEVHNIASAREIMPGDTLVLHTSLSNYHPNFGLGEFDTEIADMHLATGRSIIALTQTEGEMSARELATAHSMRVVYTNGIYAVEAPLPLNEHAATRDTQPISLRKHLGQARARVIRQLPRFCAAGEEVACAAGLHDIGKADPHFQRLLGALDTDPLLAKSAGRNPLPRDEIQLESHAARGATMALAAGQTDLVCHLIASHHGHAGTSWYPELVREYGPWQLAWMEAQVRAADWLVSRYTDYPEEAIEEEQYESALRAPVVADTQRCRDIPLRGCEDSSARSYYAALGALAAASAIDEHSQLYWNKQCPHLLTNASLDDICQWVNTEFSTQVDSALGTLEKSGWRNISKAKNQRAEGNAENAVFDLAEKFGDASVTSYLSRAIAGPVMDVHKGVHKEEHILATGLLPGNGSTFVRMHKSPPLTSELLINPFVGIKSGVMSAGFDHLLDRADEILPKYGRPALYRLLTLGILAAGRPLLTRGTGGSRPAGGKRLRRFLPRPTQPSSLWQIHVAAREWTGEGLTAVEFAAGNIRVLGTTESYI